MPSPAARAEGRWRTAATWLLAAVFLATGLGKALDITGFALVLGEYQVVPAGALLPLALGITAAELVIAAGLLVPALRRGAASSAAAMALANAALLTTTLARGIRLDNCGCFGVFLARPLAPWSPLEDVVLLVLALVARHGRPVTRPAPLAVACLTALLVAGPAAAQAFPPTLRAGGRDLILNGTGTRTWSLLRVEVYRAALYLEQPSRDAAAVLASPGVKLVRVRYLRRVGLADVGAAWDATFRAICGCAPPPAFLGWLRGIEAGDEEQFLLTPAGLVAQGPGRPAAELPDPVVARILLAAWIGPETPPEALRRGLLGQR